MCGHRMNEYVAMKEVMKVVLLALKEKAIIQKLRKFINKENS